MSDPTRPASDDAVSPIARFFTGVLPAMLLVLVLAVPCGAEEDGDPKPKPAPAPAEDETKPENPPAAEGQPKPEPRPAALPDDPTPQAGMVRVPGGKAIVGTTSAEFLNLVGGQPQNVKDILIYETPRLTRPISTFYMDRYEVTNAQYLVFLEDTAKASWDTGKNVASLDEIAAKLLRLSPKEREDNNLDYWRQLFEMNRDPIMEKLTPKLKKAIKKRPDGAIDWRKTAEALRFSPLPRGLTLDYYNRRPPLTWAKGKPADKRMNHPVSDVSYEDARAFAAWAGKHIPTEEEWEYAGRGPKGLIFPWGNKFPVDAKAQKERGNFNNNFLGDDFAATTVAVDAIPGSMSWCGCYNMIGNVAEWTSSWFQPYPGLRSQPDFYKPYYDSVLVIRGGSAADRQELTLRLTTRGFTGGGPKARPYPNNRFLRVGFRCAWYPEAGRNHLEPVIEQATARGWIKRKHLAKYHYRGASIERFAEPGAVTKNHIYVSKKSNAIVFVPMKQVLRDNHPDEFMAEAYKKATRWKSSANLFKRSSETHAPRVIVGVLHTDCPLEKVWVPQALDPKKAERARRGRPKPPKVAQGKLGSGTYLVTIWHGAICLCDVSNQPLAFLSKPGDKKYTGIQVVDTKRLKKDAAKPKHDFEIDPALDEGSLEFHLPLGGKKMDDNMRVHVKTLVYFQEGKLESMGEWRLGGRIDDRPQAQSVVEAVKKPDDKKGKKKGK